MDLKLLRPDGSSRLISALPLVLTLPIGLIAAASLLNDISSMFNPCITWGAGNSGVLVLQAEGPCSTFRAAVSETIPSVIFRLSTIQGGILTAIGLGVVGFLRSRPTLLVAGSAIMILESVPFVFDGFFILTILAAISFLWCARRLTRAASTVRASVALSSLE